MKLFEKFNHFIMMIAMWGVASGLAMACRGATPTGEAAQPVVDVAAEPNEDVVVSPPETGGKPGLVSPVEVAGMERVLNDFAVEAWYGVYFAGQKVGHVRTWRERSADPERAETPWLVAFDMVMRFEAGVGGPSNELRGAERRWYSKDWPHALVESSFVQKGLQYDEERGARRDGEEFVLSRRLATGKSDDQRVPASGETLGTQVMMAAPEVAMFKTDAPVSVVTWNWERLKDENVTVTRVGVRKALRAGIEQEILDIDVLWPSIGIPARSQVVPGKVVLESSLGPSLVMKLEERDIAMSGVRGLNVVSTAVKSPTALGDPGKHDVLVFTGKVGVDLALPSDAAQRVTRGADGLVTIHRERNALVPLGVGESEAWLKPDGMIDSDSPAIIAASADITKDIAEVPAKVAAIAGFVYRNLLKKLATHLPAASVILQQKVGDCTEHAWLTVALLRAAGIPARPVYGVAYTGDFEQVFGYHAWVEVALEGHWVAIDPTWNQASADATHLKLGHEAGGVAPFFDALQLISVGPGTP